MKRFCKSFLGLLCLLLLLCQTALAADLSKLVILHTNDTHGFDIKNEKDGINGLAEVAQLKKDLIAQGYNVLLLDAGDMSQDNNLVNFSKGQAGFEFFNAAGYDVGCLGNHEFDYGQDILFRNIKVANYPLVCSNIIVDATGKTILPPHVIMQAGDVKVGIIGFSTPETMVSTSPKNVAGLTFLQQEALYEAARQQIAELKAENCDVIIGLGHMGSEDGCMGNRSDDVLANVDGFDIFVDGHDHQVKNRVINNALLVETGNYTKNIGYVHYVDGKWQEDMVEYGAYDKTDAKVTELMQAEYDKVQAAMGQVLGTSKVNLEGKRAPGVRTEETNSGDFIADAYLWQANKANVLENDPVEIAIMNGGSIRNGINAGDVKRSDLCSVLPYNNQLMVMNITGEKLLEILEAGTCVLPDAMGAFPQVAGMKYTVDVTVPFEKGAQYANSVFYVPAKPGSRVTIDEVAGKPFDPKAVYTVVTTDFVTLGGDAYAGLCEQGAVMKKQSIGYVDEEAAENFLKEELNGVIGEEYTAPQGRITIKK